MLYQPTSSLPLESKPASLLRLCFSAIRSKRNSDGSSCNVSPMLTGLGPFEAVFPSPVPSRPIRKRFSDRTWLRDVHGRAGKRQRAVVELLTPVRTAEADNPPPTAAIINYHNNCAGEVVRGGWNKMERREIVLVQSIMGQWVSPGLLWFPNARQIQLACC